MVAFLDSHQLATASISWKVAKLRFCNLVHSIVLKIQSISLNHCSAFHASNPIKPFQAKSAEPLQELITMQALVCLVIIIIVVGSQIIHIVRYPLHPLNKSLQESCRLHGIRGRIRSTLISMIPVSSSLGNDGF